MKLVLVRHGQSEWNQKNLFTGWTDVDLTEEGKEEARLAGQRLKASGIEFDCAYMSVLKRAIKTCHIILDEMNQNWIPETKTWRLNERHYGALQGLNKAETAEKYGADQVLLWRRSYDVMPPLLTTDKEDSPIHDRRYKRLQKETIPMGETLETTLQRVIPFWQDSIAPHMLAGDTVLVVAHGNSLRSLVKHIEEMTSEEILKFELPTGQPLVYEMDKELQVTNKYFL
ncbi:2,3-diphosphoglycerate-dependent phosphoglycerate mutase [Granulicatella seriolae]|jgi:2,3-bisphosphoglycerate-dependent phosphoglycerate mutase|uniref:2,3-bisphosphoglycerate-dependent phosphoglycerate mutase n=1 Tax=Granulicatella seriolae TaxID=2967226 RepID=A0ABT1WN55_9LACT|nr:2,3-diphosphoglycerate-dependent phosphoglycerate mutase [Granulicatella seriolae]